MSLSDIVKKMRVESESKAGDRLFSYIRESRKAREVPPMKPGDCYRASRLGSLCIREEVLASKYEIIRVVDFHPMLHITLDIGDVFHDLYRNEYFGPMQEWAGAWECKVCGWDTDVEKLSEAPVMENGVLRFNGKLAKKPHKCPSCDSEFVVFKEWELSDGLICLNGHPDGWCLRQGRDRVLVDLKSHTKTGFSSRHTFVHGHDLQLLAYAHMTGDKNCQVWYLNKSPWGDSLDFVREVGVEFSQEKFVSFIKRPLLALQDSLAGGKIPERICITKTCSRANECQLFDVCFDAQ